MNPTLLNKILLRLTALVLAFTALPLVAQTNVVRRVPDRYLFILDTSSAMKRRTEGLVQAVESLMRSNIGEQLNAGDTIGIWTFDEQLATGKFPLLVWDNDHIAENVSKVATFVKDLKYQKKSNFEAVMPALKRIIENSPRLTVFVISDGNEKIAGTPYDQKIATAFSQNYKQQDKARMPFITVFRTMRGQYINGGVNLAPWPVELKELPPEPVIAKAPKTNAPSAVPKAAAPKTLPPLVVIGKKDTNAPVATFVPAAASPPPVTAATNPAPKPVITPTPPQLDPNDPNLITITAKGVEPTPHTTTTARLAPTPAPAPAPTPAPVVASNPPVATGYVASTKPSAPAEVPPAAKPEQSPTVTNPPVVASAPTTATTETKPAKADPQDVVFSFAFSRAGILVIAGVGTLLLGIGALFFIAQQRRARATPVSLITSSMDRRDQ